MSVYSPHQAKYFAHLLTRKVPAGEKESLITTILDAQVEPKPHQIDAALFAFRSPFASGAILADEVGLGKTIEAGLVIAQKWAEGKRRILIICPSSLRQQWRQELQDKFFLDSTILEGKNYAASAKDTPGRTPFIRPEVVICSYQFAANKEQDVSLTSWDLVVIDEAHRLRNVYKPGNKTANTLKHALQKTPKLLLTATPLQNSLLELYGLVSFIDERAFGDQKSFKDQFINRGTESTLHDLRTRLQRFSYRTLRKQVMEYINYTNRVPHTQGYQPSLKERELYELVSRYLQREVIYALPAGQRQLTTLIMRKLLASSSYAIAQTLRNLADRLERDMQGGKFDKPVQLTGFFQDYELTAELEDEVGADDVVPGGDAEMTGVTQGAPDTTPAVDLQLVQQEITDLRRYADIASSITHNNKADALQQGLAACFEQLERLGAEKKAIIFTESTRTQSYLLDFLTANGFADNIVLFNGSNTDPQSTEIYNAWLVENAGTDRITGSVTADRKAAIVDHFRNHAQIMIATEAAAEGINLQFCSLVVNYDLPWNPQRVEQRIGRCHRYGQKHDVVVLNFLNESNAADQRVFELLSEKFKLFEGVFGVSDEVLGAIESGVDIEKRIASIYQNCRTPEAIKTEFDQLQHDLEADISSNMQSTKQKLLENFDKDVHEKLRISLDESQEYLNKHEKWLWNITRQQLGGYADFDETGHAFVITKPIWEQAPQTHYMMKPAVNAHVYRAGAPLARQLLEHAKGLPTPETAYDIRYSAAAETITSLQPLLGSAGYLTAVRLRINGEHEEEHIMTAGFTDAGEPLSPEQAARLLDLEFSNPSQSPQIPGEARTSLANQVDKAIAAKQAEIADRNSSYFDDELDKIESWAEDRKLSLELRIRELDKEIKLRRTEARKLVKLDEKVAEQKAIKDLEKKRNSLRRELFEKQDEIDDEKDKLLDGIQARLASESSADELFVIRWKLI
ncbi:MAG TPA: SNF2-related protein [Candidatus Saccharimonadales bacterium]|jgi:superfamily II DNA or RNA helicase